LFFCICTVLLLAHNYPAAHGVLCCLLYFVGEFLLFVDVILGYLHRGTEKLCEYKSVEQRLR